PSSPPLIVRELGEGHAVPPSYPPHARGVDVLELSSHSHFEIGIVENRAGRLLSLDNKFISNFRCDHFLRRIKTATPAVAIRGNVREEATWLVVPPSEEIPFVIVWVGRVAICIAAFFAS